jgi:hypothetical protein
MPVSAICLFTYHITQSILPGETVLQFGMPYQSKKNGIHVYLIITMENTVGFPFPY